MDNQATLCFGRSQSQHLSVFRLIARMPDEADAKKIFTQLSPPLPALLEAVSYTHLTLPTIYSV